MRKSQSDRGAAQAPGSSIQTSRGGFGCRSIHRRANQRSVPSDRRVAGMMRPLSRTKTWTVPPSIERSTSSIPSYKLRRFWRIFGHSSVRLRRFRTRPRLLPSSRRKSFGEIRLRRKTEGRIRAESPAAIESNPDPKSADARPSALGKSLWITALGRRSTYADQNPSERSVCRAGPRALQFRNRAVVVVVRHDDRLSGSPCEKSSIASFSIISRCSELSKPRKYISDRSGEIPSVHATEQNRSASFAFEIHSATPPFARK